MAGMGTDGKVVAWIMVYLWSWSSSTSAGAETFFSSLNGNNADVGGGGVLVTNSAKHSAVSKLILDDISNSFAADLRSRARVRS